MRIVKIKTDVAVNPEYVASIEVNAGHDTITVRMADGQQHIVERDYQKSVWQTHDRLLKLLAGDA